VLPHQQVNEVILFVKLVLVLQHDSRLNCADDDDESVEAICIGSRKEVTEVILEDRDLGSNG
jgi:hypothetical protein